MEGLTNEEKKLWKVMLDMAQGHAPLPDNMEDMIKLLTRLNECRKANIGFDDTSKPYIDSELDEFYYFYPRVIRPWMVTQRFELDGLLFNPVDHPLLCE